MTVVTVVEVATDVVAVVASDVSGGAVDEVEVVTVVVVVVASDVSDGAVDEVEVIGVAVDESGVGAMDVVSSVDAGPASPQAAASIAMATRSPTDLAIVTPPCHDPTDDPR